MSDRRAFLAQLTAGIGALLGTDKAIASVKKIPEMVEEIVESVVEEVVPPIEIAKQTSSKISGGLKVRMHSFATSFPVADGVEILPGQLLTLNKHGEAILCSYNSKVLGIAGEFVPRYSVGTFSNRAWEIGGERSVTVYHGGGMFYINDSLMENKSDLNVECSLISGDNGMYRLKDSFESENKSVANVLEIIDVNSNYLDSGILNVRVPVPEDEYNGFVFIRLV